MAFKTEPLSPAPGQPVENRRYPLVVHRGEHPNIQSRRVHGEDEEKEALESGWQLQRPNIPEPEPEKPVLTLEQRVEALEELNLTLFGSGCKTIPEALAQLAAGTPKRGPGRPPKEKHAE